MRLEFRPLLLILIQYSVPFSKSKVFQWPQYSSTRSQDLPELYHDAGQCYFLDVQRYWEKPSIPDTFFRDLLVKILTPLKTLSLAKCYFREYNNHVAMADIRTNPRHLFPDISSCLERCLSMPNVYSLDLYFDVRISSVLLTLI